MDVVTIQIEVAYAKLMEQLIIPLTVPENTTAEQAIELSKIKMRFPEIDLTQQKIGIFSKPCALSTVLQAGDRVEIYRPLIADPKAVRKQRADEGKKMKKGGGEIAT
ncbi:hypothetical protein BegalDRAFT_1163 [Beggiatoa alba B18LD]|uniref:UPF0125 protein BegalDRAFT_1163 n=1 Tax=Beggiatoa alba B18LD TaxID=395493 RepID=I3CEM2_9GAMM|nr:RnfH family protein [Beggiatoa alba]EIJ42065.1 hypothetical protein BegalDRAFT_1163 [Beggiatoa alba B18LD]